MFSKLLVASNLAAHLLASGCAAEVPKAAGADADGFSAPTERTVATQAALAAELPPDDGIDLAEARRGFIAREPSLRVTRGDGQAVFEQDGYRFIRGAAPASANTSLWRQAGLNNLHGLYRVTEGVYQLRGYDLATMSIIEGATGLIVVDTLGSSETAARALAFARKTLGERPVVAIIFTHSHVDHFGGALAIATPQDVASGKVRVIAPEGFIEEATSENVLAGPAMSRRAMYMYGRGLPRSARGKLDNGLGKEPASGSVGILQPTELIERTPQPLTIDGVAFEFQNVPDSEAPAELTFYLPAKKAFCAAELLSRTLHNLYTLRGAKVRDARRWAGYIDDTLARYPDIEVMFLGHYWPVWGRDRIAKLMTQQRDTYLFIHDQTLRLANQGYGPREIAEQLQLPESLRTHYWNRDYYGTLRHDSKAVYQQYFGWYDANPATLDPLPRRQAATRYVAYMGGAAQLLTRARASYTAGDYRWVAEVLSHLVAAEPGHAEAKGLLAQSYDQLGYRAESAVWRNAYLTGAYELRHGAPEAAFDVASATALLEQSAPAELLQTLQVALDGPRADGVTLTINLDFADLGETYVLELDNAVLHVRKAPPAPGASATLRLTRSLLVRLLTRQLELGDVIGGSELALSGSKLDVVRFFALFDRPDLRFPIVTPKP